MTHPNAHIDAPHEPDWRPFTAGEHHDRTYRMCTKCGAVQSVSRDELFPPKAVRA